MTGSADRNADAEEATDGDHSTTGLHPLELCVATFARFNERGVRYCHWKSNDRLGEALSGGTDLDIFVERTSFLIALEEITRLGFRIAAPPEGEPVIGATHYYGLDEESGILVTLHLHVHLVVGIDLSKNFRLPVALERAYFDDARMDGFVSVPSPAIDYLVLVVRLALKHSEWSLAFQHKGKVGPGPKAEIQFLREKIDHADTDELRDRFFPSMNANLFLRCESSLDDRCSGLERMRSRWAVERALRDCSLRPLWRHRITVLRKMMLIQWSKLLRRGPIGKRPAHMGLFVAIVGGDGSGKSTVVERIFRRFGKIYDVRKVHLGRPPLSLASRILARSISVLSLFRLRWLARGTQRFPGGAEFLLGVSVARDRLRLALAARRWVNAGVIVVSDRFPNPLQKTADGPRAQTFVQDGSPGRLWRWFANREACYYAALPPCDLMVVLRVPPQAAVDRVLRRSPEEDSEGVRIRSQEVYSAQWGEIGAEVIDGSRSERDVSLDVLRLIWDRL